MPEQVDAETAEKAEALKKLLDSITPAQLGRMIANPAAIPNNVPVIVQKVASSKAAAEQTNYLLAAVLEELQGLREDLRNKNCGGGYARIESAR